MAREKYFSVQTRKRVTEEKKHAVVVLAGRACLVHALLRVRVFLRFAFLAFFPFVCHFQNFEVDGRRRFIGELVVVRGPGVDVRTLVPIHLVHTLAKGLRRHHTLIILRDHVTLLGG